MTKSGEAMQSLIPERYSGFIAVVKRDCATCRLIEPALLDMASSLDLLVFSQDDPAFPESIGDVCDDTELELSYRLDIEIVPTLIHIGRRQRNAAPGRLAAR